MLSPSHVERLTPRETEVLSAIGRRLTNPEIATELFISVRTVESHVAALLRKLGAADRSQLVAAAQRFQKAAAVELPPDTFVGRGQDVSAVEDLLESNRLVSITGMAGCGKTRLALEILARHRLMPVVVALDRTEAGGVVGAIADAIGLSRDSRLDLIDSCATALSSNRHLLLLDDCDHVAREVSEAGMALLARVRDLRILVTARSPLGVPGEAVYALGPLDTGDPTDSPAAKMFRDRVTAASPTTVLTDLDLLNVTHVCRRLDGLPLAIELAASRVRHMSLEELARRLDNKLEVLEEPGRPARHRTLEAAFSWSWDLLETDERSVLERLAGLPRDFDIDLAGAVTGPDAARIVVRLLDRSLLVRSMRTVDPARYTLLESIRSFVVARTDPDVISETRARHARFHASLATELALRLVHDDRLPTTARARRLMPDLAAALFWAADSDPDLGLQLSTALAIIVEQVGPEEGAIKAILSAKRSPEVLAQATSEDLFNIGQGLLYGDLDAVGKLVETALSRADDQLSHMHAHHLAGFHLAYVDRPAEAMTHLEEAVRIAGEVGDQWQLASIQQARGLAFHSQGLLDEALGAFQLSLDAFARAGSAKGVNNVRYTMARAATESGRRLDDATRWANECLDYASETNNRHEHAHATLVLATLDRTAETRAALLTAVDTLQATGDLRCLARGYLELARHEPAVDQIPLLRQALSAAFTAHDRPRQAQILTRLINACWDSGDHRGAARALGALRDAVGDSGMPDDLPADLLSGQWDTVIAEGRGAGVAAIIDR